MRADYCGTQLYYHRHCKVIAHDRTSTDDAVIGIGREDGKKLAGWGRDGHRDGLGSGRDKSGYSRGEGPGQVIAEIPRLRRGQVARHPTQKAKSGLSVDPGRPPQKAKSGAFPGTPVARDRKANLTMDSCWKDLGDAERVYEKAKSGRSRRNGSQELHNAGRAAAPER